jgi:predicted transposase YdaD
MLYTEWNWDDALAVRYEEGLEDGLEKAKENIARNLLAKGSTIEFVRDITGLDIETIKNM